ncbi:hypothetical protein LCGC14_1787300 [marine sediment metagenome]|uniref:Uncharacterized protein n=1 Tax=marine sediment metagenome TaxID=412755 RepID=A0A0F9J8I0_9ZZZZ
MKFVGLDKWLKPEESEKLKREKKATPIKVVGNKSDESQNIQKATLKFKKYYLVCPQARCKYQKTILKKILSDQDKNCPKCNHEMKIKQK